MTTSHVIGIDIGGSKIECALVQIKKDYRDWLHNPPSAYDETFAIISRERVATAREQGYAQIVKKITQLITNTCQQHQVTLDQLAGIGIGLPGAVNHEMKMVNGNTLALIDKDIHADLAQALNFKGKCICENDANCFVFAEAMGNIGIDFHHQQGVPLTQQIAVGLILGTGLGGGLFYHGRMFRGKDTSALELGHQIFIKDGKMCYCGRRGCSEQYLSGSALEANFNQHRPAYTQPQLKAAAIFTLEEKKDPAAVAAINQYRQHLTQLLVDISNIFDPHYIVLGGGLSKQASIYQCLTEDMQRELFVKKKSTPDKTKRTRRFIRRARCRTVAPVRRGMSSRQRLLAA